VDGIQFPFTVKLKAGSGCGKMTFEKLELNKTDNAKLFKPE
jgi:hypothetical protein